MGQRFNIDQDPAQIVKGKLYINYGTDEQQLVGECINMIQHFEEDSPNGKQQRKFHG